MKRYGHLFEQAFSKENLLAAFMDAARNKRGKRACFQFERRLAYNLEQIHTALHNGSYKPQPYYSFMVYEPKQRRIFAPAFRDLVVQHAIYRVAYRIFNAGFIDQSFACRTGKGTHVAADCRYVDDFIVFGLSRERCLSILAAVVAFITKHLNLELSRWTLAPVSRGVNFVGYRTWKSRRFIRKHSLFTFRRSLKARRFASVASVIGHASRTHSLSHLVSTIKDHCHDYPYRLPEIYRQPNHPRAALA